MCPQRSHSAARVRNWARNSFLPRGTETHAWKTTAAAFAGCNGRTCARGRFRVNARRTHFTSTLRVSSFTLLVRAGESDVHRCGNRAVILIFFLTVWPYCTRESLREQPERENGSWLSHVTHLLLARVSRAIAAKRKIGISVGFLVEGENVLGARLVVYNSAMGCGLGSGHARGFSVPQPFQRSARSFAGWTAIRGRGSWKALWMVGVGSYPGPGAGAGYFDGGPGSGARALCQPLPVVQVHGPLSSTFFRHPELFPFRFRAVT